MKITEIPQPPKPLVLLAPDPCSRCNDMKQLWNSEIKMMEDCPLCGGSRNVNPQKESEPDTANGGYLFGIVQQALGGGSQSAGGVVQQPKRGSITFDPQYQVFRLPDGTPCDRNGKKLHQGIGGPFNRGVTFALPQITAYTYGGCKYDTYRDMIAAVRSGALDSKPLFSLEQPIEPEAPAPKYRDLNPMYDIQNRSFADIIIEEMKRGLRK